MAADIALHSDHKAALGECPQWDERTASLWMMDCRKGEIYQIDADGTAHLRHRACPPCGSFALLEDGGVLVAEKEAIIHLTDDGHRHEIARMAESLPDLRFNDGACMADGSFVLGSMHINRAPGEAPQGGIYRLDRDGTFRRLAPGLGVANGPCISPLDGRLHICDSTARLIWSHALDQDGNLSDARVFADTAALDSAPDGCAFDDQGGLWTALVHAGAIVRFTPDGNISDRIDLPMAHPTAICFGGPAMDQIHVTSISDSGRLRADGPFDGRIITITGTGYRGFARPRFDLQKGN